jgi:hypothetical protein
MNDELTDSALTLQQGEERFLVNDSGAEGYMKLQLAMDKLQRVCWIQSLADWEVMTTLTFRWEASGWSAMRAFQKFMARRLKGVSYYAVTEKNPSRDGYHLHSLWADTKTVSRKGEWAAWFEKFGRCRIEPVRSAGDSAGYASKYLSKEESFLEIVLRSHWRDRLHGSTFKLTSPVPRDSTPLVPFPLRQACSDRLANKWRPIEDEIDRKLVPCQLNERRGGL